MSPDASSSKEVSSATWRLRLLDGLSRTALVLMTLSLPAMVIQTESHTHLGWMSLLGSVYLLVALGCFVRSWPYRVRASILLFGLASVAWLGLLRVGFQAGPGVGSALTVVSAGLLLGRRALLAASVLTTAAVLGMGLMHVYSAGARLAPDANDAALWSNWVRVGISYALFTGVLSVAVMFVVSHIERTLEARTQALEKLHAEQAQREDAERALSRANEQIQQMQKLEAIGRLAGGVAHDFNNALVVILGWSDLLRSRAENDAELNKALDEIANAASGAARLTQQLLSFGRKAVHVPQSVALTELVSQVVKTLARLMPPEVKLGSEIAADLPAVLVDPHQLHQVLVNLCLNGRDAMPQGGELRIGASRRVVAEGAVQPAGDWVALVVSDTGIGMDADTQKNAFEPFFTTKGELGNGLGLSSVYGIVRQTGGHVSVQSELGQGTSVTVLLPLSHRPATRVETEELTASARRRATILVAEDELAVRKLMVEALRAQGHTVVDADSGDKALELARRHSGQIDLLCTDGVMPGMASRALIAGFRRLFPEAKVLVCSGHIEEDAVREGVQQRDLRFLPKPFTGRQLSLAVDAALERG